VPSRAPLEGELEGLGHDARQGADLEVDRLEMRRAPSARAAFSARSSMLMTRLNSCMRQDDLLGAEGLAGGELGAHDGGLDAQAGELAQRPRSRAPPCVRGRWG
jgi:hypothetical protein